MSLPVNSYEYAKGGEWIYVHVPRCLLVFTRDEWIGAIKRGKSVIRNRKLWAREARRKEKAHGQDRQAKRDLVLGGN